MARPDPMMNRNPERPPFTVQCPVCKRRRGFACRTLTTGRITDTHLPRIDRAYGSRDLADSPASTSTHATKG